jgi:hypothetical protein
MRHHQGLLRFGRITKAENRKDGWAYFRVTFLEDAIYERKLAADHGLPDGSRLVDTNFYRADQVRPVNPHWLQDVLNA